MNTQASNFLKSRIVQGGLLLVFIAAIAASIAASSQPEARVKLGGTWVGRLGDITWTGSYAPDSSGQSAVITLQWMTMSADFQVLLASVGAQTMSLSSGSLSMTSNDTASGKMIWYALAPGTVSLTQPVAGQVKAIAVMTSEWHFTSPSTAEGTHNLKMYLPNAQGSLLPEDGQMFFDQTFGKVPHQKIN
jgi:hypothetical protein